MTFGAAGKEGARVHEIKDIEAILDVFQAHGHKEVSHCFEPRNQIVYLFYSRHQIDTSLVYGGGTSEEYLGKIDWQKRGILMETKLYPTIVMVSYSCRCPGVADTNAYIQALRNPQIDASTLISHKPEVRS